MRDIEGRDYNSSARLDATTATLMVDREMLRTVLAPLGLEMTTFGDVPHRMHPVCIDLWHVSAGRVEFRGIDQHAWWAMGGALAAACGAASVGAVAGLFSAGPLGAAAGTAAGALGGAAFGARTARSFSEAASSALGTYEEILVAVPGVHHPRGGSEEYTFVLGMMSNNAISIWGDRTLQSGYRKRRARIVRQGAHRYDVYQSDPGPTLSATWTRAPEKNGTTSNEGGELGNYGALFARPLLGYVDQGRFGVSHVDRCFDGEHREWTPVSGRLTVCGEFMEGLPAGDFTLPPLSKDEPWGAFQVAALVTKVTYPRHFAADDAET